MLSEGFTVQLSILKENATWNTDEVAFIKQYKSLGFDLINRTDGGAATPSALGTKHSKETKDKISLGNKGLVRSEEAIEKNRISMIKKWKDPIIAAKMKNNGRKGNSSWCAGLHHSQEYKDKIAKTLRETSPWIGKKHTAETLEKMSISAKIRWAKQKVSS